MAGTTRVIYQQQAQRMRSVPADAGKRAKGRYFYDYSLLFMLIFLFSIGLLMIYSGSQYTSMLENKGDSTVYFRKQLKIGGAGLFLALLMSKLNYRWLKAGPLPFLALAAGTVLPLLTLLLGNSGNGKTRWLSIGGRSFQPAEATKICLIVFLACIIDSAGDRINDNKLAGGILFFCLIPSGLIFCQNLSSGFIVAFICIMMLYTARRRWKLFAFLAAAGLTAFLFARRAVQFAVEKIGYQDEPTQYWLRRILSWALPEQYADDAYQTTQGLYAIGSGGLTGRGLGESIQKFGKIPEVQNDMIFTVICEEFGFFGAAAVLLVYFVILYRIYLIGRHAEDMMGSMICMGVMAHLGIQVILNIAVVTGVFPNTGVTLPFISYGGSAVFFSMLEMGLVLSVSNRIRKEI